MRHSIKRISKSALSVILALMMVVSTMVVGMVFTANAATITAWTIAGYPINDWNWSAKQITGSSGSWIFDRGESASGTTTIYFRIRCHESSNTYNYSISGSGGSLNKDTTYNLVYNTDGEMKVSVSQRYVRFTIDQAADSQTNRIKVEESATSDFGSGGETTTNLVASTNTLFVAYDKRTTNPWDKGHFWYSDGSGDIYSNVLSSVSGITSLKYYDIDDDSLSPDKQINFIAHKSDWVNKYEITNATDFKKGVQWYAYNDGKNSSNAQYTPLAIKSLSTTEVTSGQDNTITFTPDGGVPYFLRDKGTSANYTLNVYEGADTSGTQIVTNASIADATTYDFTWKPTAVTTQTTQKLTFVLTDGIDSVSYTTDYTVNPAPIPKLANPTISFDSTTIAAADNSHVTLTVDNHSYYTSLSDVTVTYKLFNGDSEVTTASFDRNGKCQISEAGTYKVQAVSSDTSKYTNSEYSTATTITKAATPEYYISGRFKVKASEDASDYTYTSLNGDTKQWDANSKVIPFTYVGDGLYKLDTYCTIKELSEQISGSDPYFLIYDGTTKYVSKETNMHDMEDHDERSKVELTTFTEDKTQYYLLFSATTSTDTSLVTLYLDTTGSSKKLYYVADSDKTPLDAPKISVDPSVLSTTATKATLTVTPAESYPEGVTYKLYRDGAYVIDFSGTTTTITSAGTYTVKAIPPADNADFKESPASNEAVVTDSRTPAVIYAKNGTVNGDSSTCKLGTTVAEAANSTSTVTVKDSSKSDYTTYDATSGSVVKVTTTMAPGKTDRYVHAFVVNGKKTYLATEGVADASGNKTYYAEFTLDSGAEKYEVTPIYYYNACKTEGEYIRFYVGASEMTGNFDWGDTIASYAYYYYDDNGERKQYESDGGWPGQPMMYDEAQQRYYALVPKEINGAKVSGLTVNNYGTDSVHAANFATTGNNVNKQTYDYDDFKIINESEYDIIRFDMKPRDVVENSSNKNKLTGVVESGNGSDADADLSSKYKDTPSSIFTDIADKGSTRWEPFLDNNGNNVSILGKAVVDSNVKVYIVSTALYKLSNRGDYMTKWFVFKETTNTDNTTTVEYVTSGCPSDFIPRTVGEDQTEEGVNTAAYKAVLDKGCATALATIVYEDVKDSRIDGRWYYAQSAQPVSAYVKFRTSDDNGQTYSELKANAAYASVNGDVSVTNPKHGMPIQVVASPLTGYIFDHWSIFDNNWNWVADVEDLGQSFETTLDAEMYYVANFYKAAAGQLEISHSKYLGDDAKGGLGYYRLEVQVYRNGAWTDITSGTGTGANGQSVSLTISSSTDTYIRIKLITETAGQNTFRYWYTRSSNGTEIIEDPDGDMTHKGSPVTEPTGLSGTLTYTFETEVWKLFRDNTQIISQMNFYSDIAPMTKNYKLTYLYDDRFGNQKSYVVTGTHDDQYYVDNKNSWAPTPALIYEKAPYIDDLYKDCTWTMTQCTKDGTDAKLTAVQNGKKYTVDIYNAKNERETDQFAINSYVKNKAGQFYVADEFIKDGDNTIKFSYWVVKERIIGADGITVTEGKEVARHFYRKYTLVVLDNYIIKPVYGEKVEDKAYISDPQYSREQTTNADGKEPTDTLYVDFMLAYMSSKGALIRDNTDGTIKTGVLVELGQKYVLPVDAEGNVTDTEFSKYAFTKNSTDKTLTEATELVNGKSLVYNYGDSVNKDYRRIYNFTANNSDYNNMNRLDYFVAFKNSPANRRYVMKAYYYVIVGDKVIISEPVCFNLYEVGTSTVS